ncbi:4-fold beta flower protein [Methylobacterium trifolii]
MIEYFDKAGRAAAFCDFGKDLYLWDGRPAGFIDGDAVFSYSGRFIGWMGDGWLCDEAGLRLLFEYDAVGGPTKPPRTPKSPIGVRGPKPGKKPHEAPPARGPISPAWSDHAFSALI